MRTRFARQQPQPTSTPTPRGDIRCGFWSTAGTRRWECTQTSMPPAACGFARRTRCHPRQHHQPRRQKCGQRVASSAKVAVGSIARQAALEKFSLRRAGREPQAGVAQRPIGVGLIFRPRAAASRRHADTGRSRTTPRPSATITATTARASRGVAINCRARQKAQPHADPFPEHVDGRPGRAVLRRPTARPRCASRPAAARRRRSNRSGAKTRPANGPQQPEHGQRDPEHDHRQAVAVGRRRLAGKQRPGDDEAMRRPGSQGGTIGRHSAAGAGHAAATRSGGDWLRRNSAGWPFCSSWLRRPASPKWPPAPTCKPPSRARRRAAERIELPQQQRPQPAGGRGQVDRQHGLRLAQSQLDQPVRKVALVAHERAAAAPQADQHHLAVSYSGTASTHNGPRMACFGRSPPANVPVSVAIASR